MRAHSEKHGPDIASRSPAEHKPAVKILNQTMKMYLLQTFSITLSFLYLPQNISEKFSLGFFNVVQVKKCKIDLIWSENS